MRTSGKLWHTAESQQTLCKARELQRTHVTEEQECHEIKTNDNNHRIKISIIYKNKYKILPPDEKIKFKSAWWPIIPCNWLVTQRSGFNGERIPLENDDFTLFSIFSQAASLKISQQVKNLKSEFKLICKTTISCRPPYFYMSQQPNCTSALSGLICNWNFSKHTQSNTNLMLQYNKAMCTYIFSFI